MCRTAEQIIKEQLGALIVQAAILTAENDSLKEKIAKLEQAHGEGKPRLAMAPNPIEQAG